MTWNTILVASDTVFALKYFRTHMLLEICSKCEILLKCCPKCEKVLNQGCSKCKIVLQTQKSAQKVLSAIGKGLIGAQEN